MNKTAIVWLIAAATAAAQPPATPLWLRGHAVIPTPRNVTLEAGEVEINSSWGYDSASHVALRALRRDLQEFHRVDLQAGGKNLIRLAVKKGTVATTGDPEIHPQGYRLKVAPGLIEITGNGDPGLFYGVQTFTQLLKRDAAGRLVAPAGVIEDWPTFRLRFLHWDTKHHQDRMETLKRYLDWSARFKVNMIGFELEDKFAYPSNPVIGAPGAFTPAELQEIVSYGLERFIQVVPVIQAPAHFAYVLKHPQFAHLRADGNNYQACLCDEETYKLIFRMYDDVIQATQGVDYFFVSTDEVYYAGICAKCTQPYNPVNRSLKWAEFAKRARDHLASRGRRMLAWLEYPLLPEHLKLIPSDVIDGVIGEPEYIPIEKEKGMRQLAYVSMQGAEFLFPDHLPLERALRDPPAPGQAQDPLEFERGMSTGRLQAAFEQISFGRVWQANPIGVFGAAWDDSGLHNETFWLGWSAVAQYGWTPGTPRVEQHAAEFMNVYYGPRAAGMVEIYRSLQRQARGWQRTWDRVVSKARGPGYGNSDGKGIGTTRYDRTLEPPPLPTLPELKLEPRFAKKYASFLAQAEALSLENDQLVHALPANLGRADRNHYNLEVFLALARFIGHHWRLLVGLADAERSLDRARAAQKPEDAVGRLVAAYRAVGRLARDGSQTFDDLRAVFEKSRHPKGRSVGGRTFVHVLDDTKDHWADRRPDLSYMIAPEQSIGLESWQKDLLRVIRSYAEAHKVPVKGLGEARLEE